MVSNSSLENTFPMGLCLIWISRKHAVSGRLFVRRVYELDEVY